MNETLTGLQVNSKDTSSILTILKDKELLLTEYKLLNSEDMVLIPIISSENLEQVLQGFDFQVTTSNRFVHRKKKNSLKDLLLDKLSEELHSYIPTSFETIGEIAIIDINRELIPFKKSVGEALLDLGHNIISAYMKKDKIEGVHRIRELELIAGERITKTIHREHGLKFAVDVETVYFSPRLATEHYRIANLITEGEQILDMFCSLAPFAFHILKRISVDISCIDINPHVKPLIEETIDLNKHLLNIPKLFVGDAKNVMETTLEGSKFDKILMNHPSQALNYLSIAMQHLRPTGIIYLYVFAPITDMRIYCDNILQSFDVEIRDLHVVRQSSPSENHVCIELILI